MDDGDSRWRPRAGVLSRRVGARVLLLVEQADEPVLLSASAGAVWAAVDEPVTAATVIDRVATVFGATSDEVAADVATFLDELERLGAVTRA